MGEMRNLYKIFIRRTRKEIPTREMYAYVKNIIKMCFEEGEFGFTRLVIVFSCGF
jgi:hypothetical protein